MVEAKKDWRWRKQGRLKKKWRLKIRRRLERKWRKIGDREKVEAKKECKMKKGWEARKNRG